MTMKKKKTNRTIGLAKKEINEEIFKKQHVTGLKNKNLKLGIAFHNNDSTSKSHIENENNIEIGYVP